MSHDLWRKLGTLALVMLLAIGGVSLTACEREPRNGVLIEGDNGIEVDVDPPGDDDN